MQKWEYKFINISNFLSWEEEQSEIIRLGELGWEIVGEYYPGTGILIFKRPKS